MISTAVLPKIIMPPTIFFSCRDGFGVSAVLFVGTCCFGFKVFGFWSFIIGVFNAILCQTICVFKTQKDPHWLSVAKAKRVRTINHKFLGNNVLRFEP